MFGYNPCLTEPNWFSQYQLFFLKTNQLHFTLGKIGKWTLRQNVDFNPPKQKMPQAKHALPFHGLEELHFSWVTGHIAIQSIHNNTVGNGNLVTFLQNFTLSRKVFTCLFSTFDSFYRFHALCSSEASLNKHLIVWIGPFPFFICFIIFRFPFHWNTIT